MDHTEGYEYSNWRDSDWEREAAKHLDYDLGAEKELDFDE